MKLFYAVILFFTSGTLIAQESNGNNKQNGIMALTRNGAYLRDNDTYCIYNSKDLSKNSIVFIYGVKKCGYFDSKGYYQILYRGKSYVIDTSEVYTLGNVYDSIKAMSPEDGEVLYRKAFFSDSLDQEIQNMQLQDEINIAKKFGILIQEWGLFDVSEYTDGTGISFEVYNPGIKTIKYITFKVIAFNAVDDKVYSSKFRNYTVTLKGVGPIKPREGGKYSWDYVWFSDLPETSRIVSIQLQYMDGSIKTITDVNKVILSKQAREALSSDE